MTIKNLLRIGFGVLFALTSLISALAIVNLHRIARDDKAILRDNYESLIFIKNINEALDMPDIPNDVQQQIIQQNITKEEKNITEPHEQEYTDTLFANFIKFKQYSNDPLKRAVFRARMKDAVYRISTVNLKAIYERNAKANIGVNRAMLNMSMLGLISLLITLLFLFKFPNYISAPIKRFISAFGEISKKNYEVNVRFPENSEFQSLGRSFNEMVHKLRDYEDGNLQSIRFERLRVETLVQNVTDAIIGFDGNERIIFANPMALKILGVAEDEIKGRKLKEIAAWNYVISKLIQSENAIYDLKLDLDGEQTYFTREFFEIHLPSNKSGESKIGHFVLLKNITRFYHLDEAKTNFIATISHELKTPIGSIKMSTALLQNERYGAITEFQQELIDNIEEDSDRLLRITSELLDMGQVQTGKLLLNFTATKPISIVSYAQKSIKVLADQKGISLQIGCAEDLPEIWADPDKTAWVLINLLTNAIKYSPDNGIVEVTVNRIADYVLEFSVTDHGEGIKESYLSRLFERYFKVPGEDSNVSGTGLGLAIAKDFITAQNGQIGVESQVNQGSRFYFTLPVHPY
ncbi:PAS domain-containing sensor histidine kinase [Mucilaginibacter sp. MD40]|uniref:sensor histidine kinase n=1 Tax=Mucilaginibacter sp. MD40 TaxID=2029590 RepID=UPI000BAC881C|nr:ATP-binding protein [Mucilaginibacter sp. MD40]PAW92838.1 PAS domain-containing sensor histidine kinase [Mucilaginibacter sp. MD40]